MDENFVEAEDTKINDDDGEVKFNKYRNIYLYIYIYIYILGSLNDKRNYCYSYQTYS